MRVVVDECLPYRLCKALTVHDAVPVQKAGYGGFKNKALLERIKGERDAFVTTDGNLAYQQNFTDRRIGVVVLRAVTNTFEDIEPLLPGSSRH